MSALSHYWQTLRLFSRDLRLFLVAAALVGFAWDGVRAVLMNLWLLRLGYGPDFVGLVNAVGAFAFAILCLPAGALGTRWGSRNMLIAGMGLLAAGSWLMPLAEFLAGDWQAGCVLLASILIHAGLSLYLVNGLPFMMGATNLRDRNHAFSVHLAIAPLAAFVGSLIAGALPALFAELLGVPVTDAAVYRYPLWLGALLLTPGVFVLLRTRAATVQPVKTPEASPPGSPAERPPYGLMLMMALIMALRFAGRGSVFTFFNVYLDDALAAPTSLVGALAAGAQLLSVPAALVAPLLVGRWGNPRVIVWGMVGIAASTIPLALVPHWTAAGFGFVSSTAFFIVSAGPMRVFSQELVAPRWQATMASAFMMGPGLSYALVSLVGGFAIMSVGYQTVFLVSALLAFAAGLLFWFWFRVPRGEMARQPVPEAVDQAR
jgi:MFS family permease